MIAYITEHWQLFAYIAALTVGFIGTLLYVWRVKVPQMENRLKELEDDMEEVKKNGVVHKPELYREDGSTVYVSANSCVSLHNACRQQQTDQANRIIQKICEVKDAVEGMERKRQQNSITFFSFMSAVKEKLDLRFTIPKNGGE